MRKTLLALKDYLHDSLKGKLIDATLEKNELTLRLMPQHLLEVVSFLREDESCLFEQLTDICGVDYPERPCRFDVVYHLLSFETNRWIRLKVEIDEQTPVPSLVGLFPGACWWEREAWDMYGICFEGTHDHRRLLTDYGFEGHPLRKDFPVTGFVEVQYDAEQKKVVKTPVQLAQAFRQFDFESPWEGVHHLFKKDQEEQKEDADESKA